MLARYSLRLFVFVFLASCAGDAKDLDVARIPNPRTSHGGWVTDGANVLGPRRADLERELSAVNRDTGAELAVVILPSIGDASPREFATALFAHWQIGRKGHDDGLLVFHVLDQRRLEIETGYGLEARLPDVKCKWLIEDVAFPAFRAGDIAAGHLALARGLTFGVRHPNAKRTELLAAAKGEHPHPSSETEGGDVAAEPARRRGLTELVSPFAAELGVGFVLMVLAPVLRVGAHRSLHRHEKRPKRAPWTLWWLSVCVALVLFASAYFADASDVLWGVVGTIYGMFALSAVLAFRTFREAKRRHAPRRCSACGELMRLLDDNKDDRYLGPGERAEERIRSVDYWVWTCRCGAVHKEHYAGTGSAGQCSQCGYQTEQLKRQKVVQPAVVGRKGLCERYYHCAHCKAQRVEKVELAALSASDAGSTSSRASKSSTGSRFGGGRSGGGGAGGSY